MIELRRATIETPVGPMTALASPDGLCALEFQDPGRVSRLDRRLARWLAPCVQTDRPSSVIERARHWLGLYFDGVSADPASLPLDMRGTPFERQVWNALLQIPPGDTTTYGTIAARIGSPAASRAVGLANGANPLPIVVPCHRVVGASGALTGYGGGLDRKAWLLDHERRSFHVWALTP